MGGDRPTRGRRTETRPSTRSRSCHWPGHRTPRESCRATELGSCPLLARYASLADLTRSDGVEEKVVRRQDGSVPDWSFASPHSRTGSADGTRSGRGWGRPCRPDSIRCLTGRTGRSTALSPAQGRWAGTQVMGLAAVAPAQDDCVPAAHSGREVEYDLLHAMRHPVALRGLASLLAPCARLRRSRSAPSWRVTLAPARGRVGFISGNSTSPQTKKPFLPIFLSIDSNNLDCLSNSSICWRCIAFWA